MFTLAQIDDLHDRYGAADTLATYLRALHDIGVMRCESFIADGHSDYTGSDGRRLSGPSSHEPLVVARHGDAAAFQRVMDEVARGELDYLEMSRQLAMSGVEKWVFDTAALTITYVDTQGHVLLQETLS